jgi:hypothetical protein
MKMAQPLRRDSFIEAPVSEPQLAARAQSPAYQAYLILYAGFIVAPLIAGADKFFHFLVNWDQYLAPKIAGILPVTGHTFMLAAGVIEIAAAALVAAKPRFGAYVVAVWLWGIIVNLLLIPGYYDIALRDFGLSLGALALGRLAEQFEQR